MNGWAATAAVMTAPCKHSEKGVSSCTFIFLFFFFLFSVFNIEHTLDCRRAGRRTARVCPLIVSSLEMATPISFERDDFVFLAALISPSNIWTVRVAAYQVWTFSCSNASRQGTWCCMFIFFVSGMPGIFGPKLAVWEICLRPKY